MLKNKIIVKKIRNILILLMAIIIMLGAYHNIRNSRAENVIELTSMAIDNYGYLSDEEFKLEARELEDDLYEVELPESVNGKKINQIVEVTLDDMNEATTEEEIVEVTDNKIYLSKEQIEQEKLNIEVEYDVVILETNEQGEYNKILLAGKTEEERAALEITEQTEMLYNKILKYEDAGNKKIVEVNGYMPIDAELQIEEVSSTKIKEIFGTAKIDVAYDIKVIHQVKSEIPEDEIKQSDEKTEIIETMEINPEDYGEIYEVSIKDINIKEKSQVFHVKENNEYEEVYIKENTKGNISFEARTFSIYGVSSDDELVATVSASASATSVEYKNLTKDGYDVYLYGVTYTGNATAMAFPTWTNDANGQDDITWAQGENLGNGTWHYRVNASAHNNEEGEYITHIYMQFSDADSIYIGGVTPYVDRTAPNPGTLTASEYNTDSSTVTIYLNQPSDNHGITRVLINGWYGNNSDGFTYGSVSYDSTNDRYYATFNFNDIVNGETGATNNGQGKYYFDAHVYDECGNHAMIETPIKVVYGLDNTLKSTANETSATSGFLGNTSLQRQDIEKVIFTDDTSNAIPIGVESQMIRSYDGYNNTGSGHASSTTSWYDFTGNQNGVITGGTFGNSYLQLDGVDDWVNLGKVNLTNQVTVDVVIELNSIAQDMTTIIGNTQFGGVALTVTYGYPGFWVYIANKGYVYAKSDKTIVAGKKVRLTGVYDGTKVSIFVDGVLQNEVQTTGNIQAPQGNTVMALGAEADGNGGVNTGYVNMKVYGVKVHTKALTTTERGSNGLIRSYDGWGNNGTNHDDTLSTWNDFTYNCHATVNGGTWGLNWLGLDGVNDWVNLGQTSFSSQVTLDVIIAPLSIQSGEVSVLSNTQTGGAAIYLSDGKPRFYVYIKELGNYISITSSTALTSNTITRITGIYDGKKAYLYVNGSLVAQTAQTGTIGATTNSTVMAIGCEPNGSTPEGFYANMNVYSAKVYNKALEMNSSAKIRTGIMRSMQGYNNTGSGHSNSTTVWNDFSSNCDGVVMGATWGSDYLEFDGVDDWVGLGEVYFTEEATLDVTIELDEITSGNAWIMGNVQNGGLALNLEDGVPQFWVWTNSSGGYKIISATQALTIGKKTRIMGRYDGTKISLYVDGVLVAEDSLTGLIKAPVDDTIMVIGCNPHKNYGEQEFTNMKVYAAKAYDRAITDSDIQQVWDVSAAGDYSILAWFGNTAAPYTIYIGSYGAIYANENSSNLFSYIGYGSNCTATVTIENLNLLNTSKATNMSNMFKNCGYRAMTSLDLGDNFDTSNATDMTGMFESCGYTAMESLNLGSKFNTSNVTNMYSMFLMCGYTKMTSLDLGDKFDTSKVTEMTCMFQECGAMAMTSLNLGPNFDTSSVTGMFLMFYRCGYTKMTSLDLGDKFDTSSVTDMTGMFNECGYTAMTSLDLGPAFTRIPDTDTDSYLGVTHNPHEDFMTDCGKSGAVIYAPEAIYKNRTSFKLSSGDTSTASGTIAVSTGRTIELKYRPEWTVETTTIDTVSKAINIQLKGATNTSNYTSDVTTALTANNISIWIDGTEITGVSKTVTTANPSTGSSITQTLTLTNFEESARQAGKSYKEWSGNITLKIEGRGEATSTYTKNVLVDSYGNQSMSEIDTTGTWTNIDFKDSTQSTANTAGKLFADFVSPEFTYEYSNTTINHNTKTVTIVFDVIDKYFNSTTLSTDTTANNITVTVDEVTATNSTKTLTKVEDITATVNGTANTKIGEKYQLVITNLDQGDGDKYSGIMTLTFPAGIVTDKSANGNIAKTITVGIDEPSEYSGPYIPEGYTQVAGTSLATGLTIQDSSGNQYVWVEVPQTTEVYPTAGLNITEFTDAEYTKIENDLHTYTSVYRNGTSYTDTYYSDAQTGLTSTQYTELKQKMLKSVYQNGGFYIGKYETGIEDAPKTSGSSSTPPTETAVIKQNAYPYNYVTCSQAQTLASEFASGLDGYTSSLMFGVQWDLVLKYLETKGATQDELNSDSTDWGNYYNNLWNITNASSKYAVNASNWTSGAYGEKTANSSILLSTGASDTFSKQGIYDLAGNVWEWTLEYTSFTSGPCAGRGGGYNTYGNGGPASYRYFNLTTNYGSYSYDFGFRSSLYKDVALDPGSDEPETDSGVIVDVVDPIWKVENINIDKTNKKVTADLIATDKYLTGTSNSTLTTSNITVSVDGDTNANTAITKALSTATFSTNSTTGLKEIKYTLTLTNWEEASKQSGKSFLEYSGTTKIEIAEGVVTDQYTNTSKEQELTLGHVDFIKPRIEKVSSTKDASGKTETIVFNVIDKYLDTSDSVAATEITAYVDGETASLTKTLTRVTANDVSATINGTSQVVSQQYKLVLSNFEQSTNNAKGYKDWSGTVTIDIAANAVKDTVSGTTANTNDKTTIKGDYVDFVNPFITYETSASDIDRDGVEIDGDGKSYQMVFTVTDKYYTSGELSTSDITVTLEDGKNTYNLKNESGVTIGFAKTGDITASNVKMTNASTGAVETVSTATIGHRYVLTISNLEELEIKTGNTTLDYSGIITVGIAKDKIVDRTGNKNVAKTITSVASLEDGSTTSVVDVVQPIWRSTSGGSINWTAKTASVVVKGTDTYYASNSLTASKIKVYAYTGSIETDITSTVNPQLSTATALNESVTVSGTTSTRQYGVQYTISLSNVPVDKNQVKVVIPAGTLTDSSGNTSEAYEIKLFTTLKSASSETEATSAFLGNSSLQRQNIESITFLDSTADANSTKWDVSAAGDNSIIAWYTGSGPYQVYIGSDAFMCANANSSYLFSYIGYDSTCTATSVINNIDLLNTSNVTNMKGMFFATGFTAMTSLNLGDNFDTSSVTDMSWMFKDCGYTAMESLNLGSKFNTSNVIYMHSMFANCGKRSMTSLSLGSNFDTSNVTEMSWMFSNCGYQVMRTLDLGTNFNTSKVTDMRYMFLETGSEAMTSLNLGDKFDTSQVTNMYRMFEACGYTSMTTLNLGDKFDTSKVTDMNNMFDRTGYTAMTSLDLGDKFYTTNVTDMRRMFNECGYTAMTELDLGPAFTKIPSGTITKQESDYESWEPDQALEYNAYDDMFLNCGKSGAVIYAPESIYKNRTSFKLSSTDTSTASGTIAVSSGRTINAIYKPEWTRESTTLDTSGKTLSVVVKGSANKSQTVNGVTINYSSNVTSTLPTGTLTGDNAKKIAVYIDGELDGDTNKNGVLDSGESPSITRTVTKDTTNSTESEVYYTIKLSNLEETARQSGKNFKEWSGNIEIKIGGRGEATSTYSANILKDTYGNQNMMETDESGSWAKVSFKDGNVTSNTANKMFTDFIAPQFTYEYSNTTINHNTKTVTVVFDITDKYFNNIDTTKLTANNITVTVGGITATGASKTLTKVQNITATVNGTANTKIGEKYQLVITNLEQTDEDGIGDGTTYSGITTLAFPKDIATDKSGNKSIAKTITIGKDEPTTGDGHDSGVIVDVVDPVWEVVESNVDQTTKTSTITLRAKDKYFKQCTLTEDKITVYVNGVASTSVVKTLSTPTDIKETVDGVANTVVGKEYTLTLGNLESSSGGGYVEFTPIDSIVGGTAKYRNENGGNATIKIAAGTIEDQYTNLSNEQTFDLGNIDVTKPEVYDVQKTKDTTAKTETIIFNVTDKNYDSTDLVTASEITVYVDNEQVSGISKSSLTSKEIKTTIDGETKVVGHQYTLVLSGFESGTKNANGYNDWSGTVSIKIAENAAKDTNGNTLNTATTTISDFVDFLKPVIEKVSSTRNTSAKTETIVFTAIDKYMNTSDLITESEIKVYVDGVETTTVDKALTSTAITKTFNKTVSGAVTSGTYTIGHTYTLVLSGFEETDAEFASSGRNYREWSGNVSIEVLAGAVKDKGPNGDDNNPNTNELTQITGDFVDFIKPRIEMVSSTKDTTGKKETIVFNVIDKYLDTSDAVTASEITTYVDGETASLTKTLSRVTANDVSVTVKGTSQVVSQQYKLVLSNFEQSANNAKGYKDYSGTVTINIASSAVKDKGPAGDSTSPNTNDATTLKGDYVDFINPFITYETSTSDIDRDGVAVDGDGKSYQMVFTVTDKYYTSGELTIDDLTITLEDGKNTYDLKSEAVTINFVKKENVTASNVKMTNASTGAVETVTTATIGHRYVLTITNLEELEIAEGNTTLDYSGIITLGIAKDKILDRTGNKNVAKTITSVASLEDGSTTSVVDVVQPIWRRTTGGAVDLTNKTASIVVNGTDTYYTSNSLTAAKIKVYGYSDSGATETDITSTVNPQLSSATALNESVTVSGTTSTRQYGVQYTISLTNLPIDKNEVKIVIPANTLTDSSGNTNEYYEIIVYTTLKSASSETSATSAFLGNSSLQRQNIESVTFVSSTSGAASNKWDVSSVGDNSIIAWYTGSGPYQVYIGSDAFMCANQNSSYLFSYIGYASTCTATSVINGLDILNTTTATNMSYMFNYCGHKAMTSLDLGDNFDTRNVTNMSNMFSACGYTAMTSLDLGDKFNTTNVTSMSRMFRYCGYTAMISLELSSATEATNTTQFNTSSVTSMEGMFNYCGYTAMVTLNLGNNFDTSSTTNMANMFNGCGYTAMTSLDLGDKFNTSKVKTMSQMFIGCGKTAMTNLNLGDKFDTSSVTNMFKMFASCGYTSMTSLDLGDKFDTTSVTEMYKMFYGCGQTSMTTLDLGPAFTQIPNGTFEEVTWTWTDGEGNQQSATIPAHNAYDDFMTNCGTSSLVVYAPESIYFDKATFKVNKIGE